MGNFAGMPIFESWIDRQIREAIERGEFDNLPGAGKPLEGLNGRDDEHWWVKGLIKRERLAPVLPGALSLRKEAEDIDNTVADARTEAEVLEIVDDLNARIVDSRIRRVDGPAVFVKRVNRDAVLQTWRRRRQGRR